MFGAQRLALSRRSATAWRQISSQLSAMEEGTWDVVFCILGPTEADW